MTRFTVDTSYFQVKVNDSYTRDWFSFRVCDGDFIDPNAAHNLAWAMRARKAGRLRNFEVYVVFRPGKNATILGNLRAVGVPSDCVVKVDVESWGGQISGRHSTELNSLLTSLRARQNMRAELVCEYANRSDFATVHPSRMAWVGIWIAAYTSVKPPNPGPGPLVGWQYSDGEAKYPVPDGWPRSSAPFGRCDHNVVYSAPLPTVATAPATPSVPVKPATPVAVPIDQEVDMYLFYVPTGKAGTYSVWERGPGVYRHVPTPAALAPLKRAGAKAVFVTAAEHAATLAAVQ